MYCGLPMTERQFYGLDVYEGDLKLNEGSIPEKFSAKIQGNLHIGSEVTLSDNFNPIVRGTLSMAVTDIPRGFNPKVLRSIHMDLVEIIPNWWEPVVGYDLFLNSVTRLPDGWAPTVGAGLWLPKLSKAPANFSPKVMRSLMLPNLTECGEYFTPKVRGTLHAPDLSQISTGFMPVVGKDMFLISLDAPDWWKPVFGGVLLTKEGTDMPSTCTNAKAMVPTPIWYRSHHYGLWKLIPDEDSMDSRVVKTFYNGKYMEVDGIFAEIISRKGNTYKLKEIASDLPIYCVTDGQDNWSHGDTLRMAHIDLKFKTTKRDLSQYCGMTEDTVVSYDDAIIMYRDITGACSFGVSSFVSGLPECNINETYTIGEILELTVGQYGHKAMVEFIENSGCL